MKTVSYCFILAAASLVVGCSALTKSRETLDYNITFNWTNNHMALGAATFVQARDACKFDGGGKLGGLCTTQDITATAVTSDNPQIVKATIHPQPVVNGEPTRPPDGATLEAVGLGKATITLTATNTFKTESEKYEIEVHRPTALETYLPNCKNHIFVKDQYYSASYSLYDGKTFLNGAKSNYLTATNANIDTFPNKMFVKFGPNAGPASLFNTIDNQTLYQAQVIDISAIDDLQINMNVNSPGLTQSNNQLYYFDLYPMYGNLSICNRNLLTKVDVLTPNACKHVQGHYKKKEVKGELTVLENIVEIIKVASGECRFRITLPERQPPLQKEFKFTPR